MRSPPPARTIGPAPSAEAALDRAAPAPPPAGASAVGGPWPPRSLGLSSREGSPTSGPLAPRPGGVSAVGWLAGGWVAGLVLAAWGAALHGVPAAVGAGLALAVGLGLLMGAGRTPMPADADAPAMQAGDAVAEAASEVGGEVGADVGGEACPDAGRRRRAGTVHGALAAAARFAAQGGQALRPLATRLRSGPVLAAAALVCALGLDARPVSHAARVLPGEARVEAVVHRVTLGDEGATAVIRLLAGQRLEDGAALPAGARVRVRLPADPARAPGDRARAAPREGARVRALLSLRPAPGFRNPTPHPPWAGSSPVDATARTLGGTGLEVVAPAGPLAALRAHVRGALADTLDPRAAGLARALVLGDGSAPAPGDAAAMRGAGLAHVLAVSGMHVTLCAGLLLSALRLGLGRLTPLARRVDPRRVASALGAPLALLYAAFAGGAPSALRAGLASAIAFALVAAGRRPRAGPVAAVAALGLAIASPEDAARPAYLLSVLATGALVSAPRADPSRADPSFVASTTGAPQPARGGVGAYARDALTAAARTTIATAPLVLWCFEGVPAVGVVANVLLVPFGSFVLLPLANLHALLAAIDLRLGALSGPPFEVVARAFVAAADAFAAADLGAALPPLSLAEGLLVTALCGALLVVRPRPEGPWWLRPWPYAAVLLAGAAALAASELHLRATEAPRGVLRATFVDVGQGDATLVDLPDGSLMLVDAGGAPGGGPDPGARALLPLLRARRRDRIDVVVLSHPHPDHYGGLPALLDAVAVGEVWDSGQAEAEHPDGEASRLLARARRLGARVRRPEELCGRPILRGGARIDVLWPCPAHDPLLEANDNSLVVRVAFGRRSLLLAGDVEREAEAAIARTVGRAARADVLKVAHHGSRTSSTPPFLAAVAPRLAVISAGLHNRFGHPHPEVEEALAARGTTALRLDAVGGVTAVTDGERWVVRDRHGARRWALDSR